MRAAIASVTGFKPDALGRQEEQSEFFEHGGAVETFRPVGTQIAASQSPETTYQPPVAEEPVWIDQIESGKRTAALTVAPAFYDAPLSEKVSAVHVDPLVEQNFLSALLFELFSQEAEGKWIDIQGYIKSISSSHPLKQIPRIGRRSLQRGVQCVFDVSTSMDPFQADMILLRTEIERLFSASEVDLVVSRGCPSLPNALSGKSYRLPAWGRTVLAITRLRTSTEISLGGVRWLEWLRMLQKRQCKCTILAPCDPAEIPREAHKLATVVAWDFGLTPSRARKVSGRAIRTRLMPYTLSGKG
jgi:hypothetical protein